MPAYVGPDHLRYDDGLLQIYTNVEISQVSIAATEIAEKCLHHPIVKAAVGSYAKQAQSYWKSIAPVSARPPHPYSRYSKDKPDTWDTPGAYRDSIKVRTWANAKGFGARVYSNDVKAGWIEFGTEKMSEFACAARTAENFGGSHERDVVAEDAKAAEEIGLAFCRVVA
ncbi:hypothetical protein KV112_04440 [Mycolicibacter sp. MYC123]|uniref:Uncharacterized protein n=1 Tax=[Mycobacterium] zoologicum TaxID=2872311 RepID=A0ABU5YG58_9MYCO|nr:hypothetical protein [Mycolicibacter sp. MYC123]MEB3048997.1 hypothetical protein [Mycolicibacter sp. MYC123]